MGRQLRVCCRRKLTLGSLTCGLADRYKMVRNVTQLRSINCCAYGRSTESNKKTMKLLCKIQSFGKLEEWSRLFAWIGLTCFPYFSLAAAEPRPQLQIINGSDQTMDIWWIKSDAERVSNGSIPPRGQTSITTTLGHRFAVVGRKDQQESIVTSDRLIQAFRFGGVPEFYTQQTDAHGYPIVASEKVNPYALKEAAYLIDMMLAKRPDAPSHD